jgi:L-lactate dehydrogenase complex protein LldG
MVETTLMNARDEILNRITSALRKSAQVPGHHNNGSKTETKAPDRLDYHAFLPKTGANTEENIALFRTNAAELKADFYTVKDMPELLAKIAQLKEAEGWKKAASHNGNLTNPVCEALKLPVCLTDAAYEKTELEKCDVGISQCDALVAQTGSALVTSRSAGGRALSVLPPHHVILATRDQLLPGLPEAMQLIKTKYASNYPSMISFITGPSRTGDIERILVLGAHGPKKLTIFCLD